MWSGSQRISVYGCVFYQGARSSDLQDSWKNRHWFQDGCQSSTSCDCLHWCVLSHLSVCFCLPFPSTCLNYGQFSCFFFLSLFAQSPTYPCVSQSILCLCLALLLSVFWNHNRVPADFSVAISSWVHGDVLCVFGFLFLSWGLSYVKQGLWLADFRVSGGSLLIRVHLHGSLCCTPGLLQSRSCLT